MLVVCHIVTSELIGALSTQFSDNAHIGSMHEFLWQCKGTGIFIPIAVYYIANLHFAANLC